MTTFTAFHGTDAAFETFEPGVYVGGNWFTSDRAHAASFGIVGEYRLTFANPVVIDGKARKFECGGWDADAKLGAMIAAFVRKGHDGAIVRNWEGRGDCYVAVYGSSIEPTPETAAAMAERMTTASSDDDSWS